ncbi:hypothetical protein KI688_004068 [Linnemannia hyalina]|uniref:Uncharacterized protein n=1 Tax=Linnemannia hyalina TaxID=64524 RepID=A0A9P8BPM1_9FUNG|nr:hypothetical protein KI688_004068 [Linnemannia hyalina]
MQQLTMDYDKFTQILRGDGQRLSWNDFITYEDVYNEWHSIITKRMRKDSDVAVSCIDTTLATATAIQQAAATAATAITATASTASSETATASPTIWTPSVPDTMDNDFELLDIEDEVEETSQNQDNDNRPSSVPREWTREAAESKLLPNAQAQRRSLDMAVDVVLNMVETTVPGLNDEGKLVLDQDGNARPLGYIEVGCIDFCTSAKCLKEGCNEFLESLPNRSRSQV